MDAGADRVPPGVGETDPGDQPVPRPHRVLDQAGSTSTSRSLAPRNSRSVPSPGTSPQARPRCRSVRSPRTNGPPKSQALVAALDGHLDLPPRGRGIAGHRLRGQPGAARHDQRGPIRTGLVHMHRHVDVLVPGPVGFRVAGEPGQVIAVDQHGQRPELRDRPPGRAPRRGRRDALVVGPPEPAEDLVVDVARARPARSAG